MEESIYKNAYNFINNGPIWTVLYIAMISFDTHDTQLNQENHHNTWKDANVASFLYSK